MTVPVRKPGTVTLGDGFTAIDFPEVRVGPYRAVQYGCQNVCVYHDSDPRRVVWGDYSLDLCEAWMVKYEDVSPVEAAAKENAKWFAEQRAKAT